MKVIGITGGVGSGKSRVLALLEEEFGATVILADEVARQLEEPGQPGFARLTEYFGREILGEDGHLDRARLAARIFEDQEALEAVNRMIHPLVWQAIRDRIAAVAAPSEGERTALPGGGVPLEGEGADAPDETVIPDQGPSLVAIESALFDSRTRSLCQEMWLIDTSDENRISRLMAGRGYSREKCLSIIRNQRSREEFLAFCDVVIDNNGSLEQVRQQIHEQIRKQI